MQKITYSNVEKLKWKLGTTNVNLSDRCRLIGQYSWETYKTSYALKEHAPRENITCGTCKLIDNQITEPYPSKDQTGMPMVKRRVL